MEIIILLSGHKSISYFAVLLVLMLATSLVTQTALALPSDEFVTTWNTQKPGSSDWYSITVPMVGGPYDVDWNNDGVFDDVGLSGPVTHDYGWGNNGTHTIRIRGAYDSIRFDNGGDKEKILSIDQWGTRSWTSMESAFYGAKNLTIPATDIPDFSSVNNMSYMFCDATSANPKIDGWDTSSVEDMSYMFSGATSFNRNIGQWNVTALTNALNIFEGVTLSTTNFERLLLGWDAQPLQSGVYFNAGNSLYCSAAAVAARTNMISSDSWVISGGREYCDPVEDFVTTWKTDNPGSSNLTSITVPMAGGPYEVDWNNDGIFDDIGLSGSVTHDYQVAGTYKLRIRGLYDSIRIIDGGDEEKILSIDQWGAQSWTSMEAAFTGTINLTVPAMDIPDFSAVTNMSWMFSGATSANPDTSGWDTSAVTNMSRMFNNATSANPDTSGWDTSAVTDMSHMFSLATSANPDTSGWDTSTVTDMSYMFNGATSFNRDLGAWNVTSLTTAAFMFDGTYLSTPNYESLLIGWDAQLLQFGVFFSGGGSRYCSAAAVAARANMTSSDFWTISDGGQLCHPSDDFVTTWKTDNPGFSNNNSIRVPMIGGPYEVDWNNDGTFDESGLTGTVTHDFTVAGTYTIRIRGVYDSIRFPYSSDREKILSLDQWGTQSWKSMDRAFYFATNLIVPATDIPDFSALTSMSEMFAWATSANPDTSAWDTSAVKDMSRMFLLASSANPDTSGWDTATVTDMSGMFEATDNANPDTSGWDTSAVTNMEWMFHGADMADPDTSGWDTSAVTRMSGMFEGATSANPDTSAWDTSAVIIMSGMFAGATSANPDTSGWDTSAVKHMWRMFAGATSANPDTSAWDTSAVIDMSEMFAGATSANPDTTGWNTTSVSDMREMFRDATSFNQDIGSWSVVALRVADGMFRDTALSTANYESLLTSWAAQLIHPGITFDGGNSIYCSSAAIAAREKLVTQDFWTITDGGLLCPPIDPTVAPDLTPDTDNGLSDSDNITSNRKPSFYVECSAIGNTITLFTDNALTDKIIGTHLCANTGTEIAQVTVGLVVGIHHITYTDQNVLGESLHSPALEVSFVSLAGTFDDDFVSTWKTDNPGTSNSTSIAVPLVGGYYAVDWDNDGVFDQFDLNDTFTHDYGSAGTYTIRVRGDYDTIRFNNVGDKKKILSVDQWGTRQWTTMESAFHGAVNLTVPAADIPDFSAVQSMSHMFSGAINANPDTSSWDTSAVTDMSGMFSFDGQENNVANPDTSNWDTSSVSDMSEMFRYAVEAIPDTSGWNTSAVTDMSAMFFFAILANPDTSGWDTSSVTDMSDLFANAFSAEPDTSGWNTSSVTDMSGMFNSAINADPDTSGWDTSSVADMSRMFKYARKANPDTSGWDTSSVVNMSGMFYFYDAPNLANPDTSGWDTSSVRSMSEMFSGIQFANPDTSGWITASVENMSFMFFNAPLANPDTSGWDTGSVTNMESMFEFAFSFNRDIGSWDVTALTNAASMFGDVKISTANYDSLLIGWESQLIQRGVVFSGGDSTYCSDLASAARNNMEYFKGWSIGDGGQACPPKEACNTIILSATTDYFDESHEACEILVLGPDYTAADGASVSVSSGWEIHLMPGLSIEPGAILNANVCGQSLCMQSTSPMPYGCHSCVTRICDADPFCCDSMYDQICLDKVDTVCGLTCD